MNNLTDKIHVFICKARSETTILMFELSHKILERIADGNKGEQEKYLFNFYHFFIEG